ncbi:MAG: PAS domain S-box protein, partial [Cyanobacteria bacterium J06632_3]
MSTLFSTQYIPHGHCYLWQTPLVGLHAVSDFFVAIAYFSIPISLVYFVYKKQHKFPARLVLLFGLFISLCGLGHLLDIVTLWYPVYWLSGGVRAATAIVSCYTAVEVVLLLPHFLSLQAVEAANQELEAKAAKRTAEEQALEKSQKIFRSAFHDIPIGMALVSLEGYFLEVNEAVIDIVGYSREELASIDFQSITHPDDLQSDLTLVSDLLAGNLRCYSLKKRYFHRSGHIVPVELSVSLLRDDENKPLLFIAHINDISERNRINASLKAASEEAEAASRAKSNFLAMMSHEIRTPMNAMLGMTELIGETALDRQQKGFVDIIRTSGEILLTVINDVLDFSKIESNRLELDTGQVNLCNAVEEVMALFANQAHDKGLALSSFIEPVMMPAAFVVDNIRLKQIL